MSDHAAMIAFLRARIDEDEQIARNAAGATWGVGTTQKVEWGPMEPWTDGICRDHQGQIWPQTWTDDASHIYASAPNSRMVANMSDSYTNSLNRPNARHIAHWDPARVLAEVEVKRRIISECEKLLAARGSSADLYRTADLLANDVLRLLASTYVDHPDFDPSWRVFV